MLPNWDVIYHYLMAYKENWESIQQIKGFFNLKKIMEKMTLNVALVIFL